MKKEKIIIAILAVGAIIYLVWRAWNSFKDGVQNAVASTPIGWIGGVRSAAGQRAADKVMGMKFLTEKFYEAAEKKYNTIVPGQTTMVYHLDYMGTDMSNAIAHEIWGFETVVAEFFLHKSEDVVNAVLKIKNQCQAAEVTRSFFLLTGKDLNKGIMWISDTAMVQVADYFSNIPTGVYKDGRQLNTISV